MTTQGRLKACHRQDVVYPNLCVNDHPACIQSVVFEDRDERIKCLTLGVRIELKMIHHPADIWPQPSDPKVSGVKETES